MEKTKCSVCGKEFKNMGVHMKKKHGVSPGEEPIEKSGAVKVRPVEATIVSEEFEADFAARARKLADTEVNPGEVPVEELETDFEPSAVVSKTTEVNQLEIQQRIWNQRTKDPDRPLSEFLIEFGFADEQELVALIKKRDVIPITERIENDEERGRLEAGKLAGEETIRTPDTWIAEGLQGFGYSCEGTERNDGIKVWVMKKM